MVKLLLIFIIFGAQLVWSANLELPAVAVHDSPDLRLWGWSPDGKVAYSTDYTDNAPRVHMTFAVFDAVTDDVIFQFVVRSDELGDSVAVPDATIALYNKAMPVILFALKHFDIRENKSALMQFPLKRNGVSYEAIVADVKYPADEDALEEYTVLINATGENAKKTQKIVSREDYSNFEYSFVYSAEVRGYFLSPFEHRILLVVVEQIPNHDIKYRLYGSHLGVGFK
ncbi:MAG: hypothetical protein LBV04_05425 [Deferribacteraceae bacterium]|jgi:hypothetical protein|nr:hypothetical protein [Deferribacteraceae bacterium]